MVKFVADHKRCALHADIGTGKTSTTILACAELLDCFDIRGVMVFAPLRVATIAWPGEFAKWDQFRNLTYQIVRGTTDERAAQLRRPANFHILNYDHLPWWVEWLAQQKGNPILQDMLVLDESSRLKSSSSNRFKDLKPMCDSGLFPRIIELTGTPAPERYSDLWSQYRLLDRGAALFKTKELFDHTFLDINPYNRHEVKLKKGADTEIQRRIAPITVTVRGEDYLKLPPVIENDFLLPLPDAARRMNDEFIEDMIAEIDGEQIAAVNRAIVSEKCRQVASGGVYTPDGRCIKLHEDKFDQLDEIIEYSQHPLLVAYWYRHELETIKRRYPTAPALAPKETVLEAQKTVARWNQGKIPLLFMHPASVGHGINLQEGGHDLVWLTIPWSNELYQQTIGRLRRQGQPHPVRVHRILMRETVDMVVDSAVNRKEFTQADLRFQLAKLQQSTI